MDFDYPLKILSIDPATGKSGWSSLNLISTNPILVDVLASGQIDGEKLLRSKKEMSKTFNRQFCILDALYEEYVFLIETHKPDVIVSEGAFGYTHMSAVISLTLAIHTLRRAARDVLNQNVIEIPPTISKKSFTGHGGADKEKMRITYLSSPFIVRKASPEDLSEHEIDSVAHGIGYIRRDIIKDVIQVSAKDRKSKKK